MKLALGPPLCTCVVFLAIGCSGAHGAPTTFDSVGGYGSDGGADVTTGGATGGGPSSGNSSGGSGSGSQTSDEGGACMAHCSVDSDCQSACPAAPSGSSNCCSGGMCYLYAGAACQDVPEAGTTEQ